jgi:hypothetical protein
MDSTLAGSKGVCDLRHQLAAIEPSGDGHITYHSCAVVLVDGAIHERVYIQERASAWQGKHISEIDGHPRIVRVVSSWKRRLFDS